ncbi:MAG: globin domain-containing protein [Sulfuricurvum sp.]
MSLSQASVVLIKESIPLIAQNAEAITKRMYGVLFQKYPETKELFASASPDQHKKLASAIAAYASNIDNIAVLGSAVEKMALAHVSTHVLPKHYPMVADALLLAMGEILGEDFNDELKTAWTEAYLFLADILINREAQLYAKSVE